MSFLNLLVSTALGVSPDELSAVRKTAEPKQKPKDSVSACSSSISQSSQTASSASNPTSSTTEQQRDKETKEAGPEVEIYRPEDKVEEGRGELPKYSATSGELPRYEDVAEGAKESK
ncbi:hypothetical protein BKA61DRAFT_726840 [Leptodontidium sp. MPI-SDFR-AT-0119]|nr:hypothetical protein BKA61DRAFT_726840 [Leptodontidium sp. MPI-SDFR-AT-0119]